jgi:hypothetical protein
MPRWAVEPPRQARPITSSPERPLALLALTSLPTTLLRRDSIGVRNGDITRLMVMSVHDHRIGVKRTLCDDMRSPDVSDEARPHEAVEVARMHGRVEVHGAIGPSRRTPRTWSSDTVSGGNSASHQVAPASA